MKTGKLTPWTHLTVSLIIAISVVFCQNAEPTYSTVPYGPESRQWLHIYCASNDRPAPLFIWSHGNGSSASRYSRHAWDMIRTNGISAISWESLPRVSTPMDVDTAEADFDLMFNWVLSNAARYGIDTNRIVIGGSSRGSVISWKKCHTRWREIRGIYMNQALPDPVWAAVALGLGESPLKHVHTNSPGLFLVYSAPPDTPDIHDPLNGMMVTNRYAELGIGERARLVHSLVVGKQSEWKFLPGFFAAAAPASSVQSTSASCTMDDTAGGTDNNP
ncbi:MAG: hypothetical protein HZC28_17415 [Spirochaetes bacterium]|nr:hypothetical protein [Spirochaetota bacterium]